jgi:hypothetical protein
MTDKKNHLPRHNSTNSKSELFITNSLYLLLRNEDDFEITATKMILDSKKLLEKMTIHSSINTPMWHYLIATKLHDYSISKLLNKVNYELLAKHLIKSLWK